MDSSGRLLFHGRTGNKHQLSSENETNNSASQDNRHREMYSKLHREISRHSAPSASRERFQPPLLFYIPYLFLYPLPIFKSLTYFLYPLPIFYIPYLFLNPLPIFISLTYFYIPYLFLYPLPIFISLTYFISLTHCVSLTYCAIVILLTYCLPINPLPIVYRLPIVISLTYCDIAYLLCDIPCL